MEMGDQYGLPDLRRLLATRPHFPAATQQPSEPYFVHRNMAPLAPYNESNFMVPGGLLRFGGGHDNHHFAAAAATSAAAGGGEGGGGGGATASGSAIFGVEMENGGWSLANFDVNNSRWPRQETLTLLEIRSRLDSKFKEANQKGPLWNEISRIMAEEHGYHRTGKKCREKFENLYKYYKKTKEGKAGRQDGKNYRFFRQLEALYGETNNQSSLSETNLAHVSTSPNFNSMSMMNQETQEQKLTGTESLSFSNASEFETSSSENNDQDDLSTIAFMMKNSMAEENNKQKRVMNESGGCSSREAKKGWKAKVNDFVESQMKKIIDSQDVWMERMLKTIEDKEQERMLKEEEWRRRDAARFEKEHYEFWAKERAWIEARDASLMEVLKKFSTGKGLDVSLSSAETHSQNTTRWAEHEVSCLIQLRTSLEPKFQQESTRYSSEESGLWEEIEAKMVSLGYERDAAECKEKWDSMQMYFNMTNAEPYKKRKEDFRRPIRNNNSDYFQQLDSYNNQGDDHDQQHPWEDRYGLKLSKGKNHHI